VLHAHLSEQPAENEACAGAYGMTPAALLADAGAVSERFTAVHATHLAAGDFDLLGRAGATCCMCPTTERDLGDGIGPAARLRDAGTALALGSDSHAMIEPLEEARAVELDERLAHGARGSFSAPELLRALTAGGYESIGWPEGGRIEPGAPADLVTFALDRPHLAGTASGDELASLVFAGSAADVDRVIAGGRTIVRDGRHVNLDVPRELVRTIERVRG
jgi:cytosine/adenosine deaminase-related metal-dependent hydrolase